MKRACSSPLMATLSSLTDWLKNPSIEIRLTDSEEVEELRAELEAARAEMRRAQALYGQEVNRCLRYEEYLKSIGINPKKL